jgi:cell division protein FtsI (penicillin-binding protein 3)
MSQRRTPHHRGAEPRPKGAVTADPRQRRRAHGTADDGRATRASRPAPPRHRTAPSKASGAATRRPAAAAQRRSAAPTPRTLQRRVIDAPRPARHVFRPGRSRRRLLAVFVFTFLLFSLVVGRVVFLQITSADELRAAGREQRTTEAVLLARRGVIFDRNGDELAMSVPARTIVANPKLVGDPAATAATLAQVLQLSPEKQQSLLEAFTVKDKGFVYVAHQVSDEQAGIIADLDLNGVSSIADDRRIMPSGDVGRSVIGRTDPFGAGSAGIEKQLNTLLTGVNGELIREHDRKGRSIAGTETTSVEPTPGNDVVLSLDRSVQYTVEQELLAQVRSLQARGGTAVVLSTKTGDVIAMASALRDDVTGEYRLSTGNLAAVDAAEPGSVVKAATLAAALNEGGVTPETTFEVPWRKQFSDTMLHDAEQHPDGVWNVGQILTESSNIGTIEVMLRLSPELRSTKQKLHSYLRAFGLGEKTALDFPGESAGLLKDWKKWEGAEQYTMAYGQGLASTSVQLAAAINVIANGGTYVAPRLLVATIGPDGTITDAPASATHRVIRPEVAAQVTEMMRSVVCSGTATRAQVPGLSIAGKTGTGLKAQDNGTYLNDKGDRTYYASFVGFFPAEDPQATVLISIDEPPGAEGQLTRFGGTAAAPVFARVAPAIMRELDITPPVAGGGCPGG